MIDVQTIGVLIAAASVVIGVMNSVLMSRREDRRNQLTLETRQAQLFMQIYQQFNSKEFMTQYNDIIQNWSWADFDDFIQKYASDIDTFSSLSSVGTFFEGIGVLVKRGLVDPGLVDDLMSGHTMQSWEKLQPFYIEGRRRWNWPQLGEWWEYLYNEIKAIVEKQHPEFEGKLLGTR